ncbi:hypothetical protein ACFFX0_17380 [Citricoccus parietis]|uniref:Uncharacterized protein n=1 Tax=Citricoccus parietis TaxID=592307 RepID=A0ABV5G1R0_9MICC
MLLSADVCVDSTRHARANRDEQAGDGSQCGFNAIFQAGLRPPIGPRFGNPSRWG